MWRGGGEDALAYDLGAPRAGGLAFLLENERVVWPLRAPVMLGAGGLFYFSLRFEPPLMLALAAAGVFLGLWIVLHTPGRQGPVATVALASLVFMSFGFAGAKVRSDWVTAPVIEKRTGTVSVSSFVELIEPSAKRGERVTLRPYAIEGRQAAELPARVRVRVLNPLKDLKPGDAVNLKAKLSPPPAPALPGGFDFARYVWFLKLGGVGYAMARPSLDDGAPEKPWWLEVKAGIAAFRQAITERVYAALPGQTGAIAAALLTGERGAISGETNKTYRDSGLFHILSISGMHMAIMAGTLFLVARVMFAAVPGFALRYPVKKWSAVIAALSALGYLMISGAAFATVRSYIMISVLFFAVLIDRPALALYNIAVAATIILLLFPESVLDPGFQMSFAAVTALISAYEFLRRSRRGQIFAEHMVLGKILMFAGGIVLSTFVAGLAVAPLAAYHFHTTQHFAVVANLAAVPLSNLIVMPAALVALLALPFGLEAWPLTIMGIGVDGMTKAAEAVAALPGAIGHVKAMPNLALFLIVAGGLWLMLWQRRWRLLRVPAMALGLLASPYVEMPTVLAGHDGQDVLIRDGDGRYRALDDRRAGFEVRRWLAYGGDPLERGELKPERLEGAKCDRFGCVVRVHGLTLAHARHVAAFADDCRTADILIIDRPRPKGCTSPKLVIDFFDVRYAGTHAVFVEENGALQVTTVADVRGARPWTKTLPGRDASRRSGSSARQP